MAHKVYDTSVLLQKAREGEAIITSRSHYTHRRYGKMVQVTIVLNRVSYTRHVREFAMPKSNT